MGPDAAHLAASLVKSVEVDRSPHATQRASEIAQDQLAGQSAGTLARKKTSEADHIRREKIRQDRERRRRQLERRSLDFDSGDPGSEDGGSILDVVA